MSAPTGVQPVDAVLVLPVLVTAAGMLLVLVVGAVRPTARLLLDAVAVTGLGAAVVAVAVVAATGDGTRGTFCVAPGEALSACSYVSSPLTTGLQVGVVVAALVCLLLALDGPGARPRPEHHALLLASVTGALVVAGARDLLTLVIALETSTLPVVGLVALRRDRVGAEAALKLLLVSVVSFGLTLMGVALLFAATGSVHLDLLRADLATGDVESPLLALGAALVLSGVAYKLSAVPFGLWTPDVYAGSPVPVAAFLSTVSKVAGLGAVVVVLTAALPLLASWWGPVVGVLAAVSMTVGNVVALTQRSAVRLLAWSTVAQAGWVLLPLGGGLAGVLREDGPTVLGSVETTPGAQAASVYLLAYVVASLAAFTVVVLVTRHHVDGAAHGLDAYRGLARREPVAAGVLALALLSLAGLPPGVAGLVGKVVAVGPVVDGAVWWLGAVAAVNVVLGLAYYLRWAALLVARAPEADAVSWDVRSAEGVALGVSGGLLSLVCVLPGLLVGAATVGGVGLWP